MTTSKVASKQQAQKYLMLAKKLAEQQDDKVTIDAVTKLQSSMQ